MNIATGIEVYELTAADLGIMFVAALIAALVIAAFTWWIATGGAGEVDEPEVAEVADADPDATVEIRPRGRRRPPITGTIHAPGVAVPPDATVVLDTRQVVRDAIR